MFCFFPVSKVVVNEKKGYLVVIECFFFPFSFLINVSFYLSFSPTLFFFRFPFSTFHFYISYFCCSFHLPILFLQGYILCNNILCQRKTIPTKKSLSVIISAQ